MSKWRFYGREEEFERLEETLRFRGDPGNFASVRILGRRGVGKTEFMREAALRAKGNPPVLHIELPPPDKGNARTACLDLRELAIAAGLSEALDALPDEQSFQSSTRWFRETLRCLIHAGAIVVLDEFHHSTGLRLVGGIKLVIDGFYAVHAPRVTGKLVMMGSHQQKLLRMFRSTEPLYGRARSSHQLDPWPVSTVLEMAAEQGYLQYPKRFLTLWTAYGGIPKHWARLAEENDFRQLRQFDAWSDDTAWRREFLKRERQVLTDPEEHFDSRAVVELASMHRDVLLWLASNRPRGADEKEIAAGIGKKGDRTVSDALRLLKRHLQLVEPKWEFLGKKTCRWRISDNNTLFQINVFPQLFADSPEAGLTGESQASTAEFSDAALASHEGPALERFAAACFGEMPDVTWHEDGLWRNRRQEPYTDSSGQPLPPLADIDVMARRGEWSDPEPVVIMAGCKRNASKHNRSQLQNQFDAMLNDLGDSPDAKRVRRLPKDQYLISPHFTESQREKHKRTEFKCLDIRDLARIFDIDPGPEPIAEPNSPKPSPQPRPRRSQEQEDGPSLDM